MDRPLPWLRYVDADTIEDNTIDFDGLAVESPSGEHLGDVDGFVVDSASNRPYYVVVDSGGWFKSKNYLLPVGHARFDADREALVADLTRDRIDRFPGFDKDEFPKLSEADLKRFNDQTCQACSISGVSVVYSDTEPYSAAWDRPDYAYPSWWGGEPLRSGAAGTAAAKSVSTSDRDRTVRPAETYDRDRDREQLVAREGDVSPHFDGRAQPGDVIGVETGGERTTVGDTAESENRKRRDAEEADRKRRT